jgi:hypothetical protein
MSSGLDLNVFGNNAGNSLIQGGPVSNSANGYSNQWSLTRATGGGTPYVISASEPTKNPADDPALGSGGVSRP